MKLILVKAKSRLGLYNNPIGQPDKNEGVEFAPDKVLSEDFIASLGHKDVELIEKVFSQPEVVAKEDYAMTIYKESAALSKSILDVADVEDIIITVGGDHSISLSSLHAVSEIYGMENIGFIQIDSHGDIHLLKTSPTGNFHGMYLRPLFDSFDFSPINTMFMKKAKGNQMIYIGNLDIEPEETDFIQMKHMRVIDKVELMMKQNQIKEELKRYCEDFKHIHLSFDVDGIDKSQVLATGIPAENGLFIEEVMPLVETVAKNAQTKSLDVVEVNPIKQGAKETIRIAQDIISIFI